MTIVFAAIGVQNKFDRIIDPSGTPCSFSTFTACMTVLPVDIMGYMSSTWRLEMSSGNRAYTTRALCVSASDSIKILPIRIERQQSRSPCSMASPDRTIDTPQLPERYLRPSYVAPVGVTTEQSEYGN